MKKIKTLIIALVFVLFIAGAVFGYNKLREHVAPELQMEDQQSEVQEGENKKALNTAPDFSFIDYNAKELKLSDFFGKPIVLNFWASWCPPCKSEMPEFDKFYEELGNDVAFVMVDLVDGSRETIEKGKNHVEEEGFLFPIYFDTTGEAGSKYGISSIPTTFFIDKEGFIVASVQGAIDRKSLRLGINSIIDEE